MLPNPHNHQQPILACLQQLALVQVQLMLMAESEAAAAAAYTVEMTLSTGAMPPRPTTCSCGPHCPHYPCWA